MVVLPAGGISPHYRRSCGDVDVKWLEIIVDYCNGIGRICTLNDSREELKRWSDDEGNKNGSYA